MKLKYTQKKKFRVKRFGFLSVSVNNYDLWFSHNDGKLKFFEEIEKNKDYPFSSHSKEWVKSVKAFKRWIKKHNEIPIGTQLTLHSKWVGFNVEYIKK